VKAQPALAEVMSRGQTGADQAGWRLDCAWSIRTRAWMPHCWYLTKDGLRSDPANPSRAVEITSAEYVRQTPAYVRDPDGTSGSAR
jgi:hypothetical protein